MSCRRETSRRSRRGRRWHDYTRPQRTALGVLAFTEVALAVAAWRDLARRDRTELRGARWAWALIIAVNIVGPLAYFRWGRVSPRAAEVRDGGEGHLTST